jgi:hypothetical protein
MSSVLTSRSFARIRFEIVIRFSRNLPFWVVAQQCVKPKKSKVSGRPRPRAFRRWAANRPNSIKRLLVGQFQVELREPLAKVSQEPLGVLTMLKARHVVVGEAHEDHVPSRVPPSPLVGPQVEDVVQIDVREQRRSRGPLWNTLIARRPRLVLDDPCADPLADQTQDPAVRDPVLEKLLHPSLIKPGEEVADVRV